MSDVRLWDPVDGNNNQAPPNGWPEGQAPSTVNDCARADKGGTSRWHRDTSFYLTSTGAANAYALTPLQTYPAYAAGMVFGFIANFANTDKPTLNVSALGAKTIRKGFNTDLLAGDINIGQLVVVAYQPAGDYFEMLSVPQSTAYVLPNPGNNAIATFDPTTIALKSNKVIIENDDQLSGHSAAINAQTGTTYTVTTSDNGKVVTLTNAAAITVTFPAMSTLQNGFQCTLIQRGAGQVTIAKDAGDTLESKGGATKLSEQHSIATMAKLAATVLGLYGDITS